MKFSYKSLMNAIVVVSCIFLTVVVWFGALHPGIRVRPPDSLAETTVHAISDDPKKPPIDGRKASGERLTPDRRRDGRRWIGSLLLPGSAVILLLIYCLVKLRLESGERERVEKALEKSEGKVDAMLQSIDDPMYMIDGNLTITWANDSARAVFGDRIVGKKRRQVNYGKEESRGSAPIHVLRTFQDGGVYKDESWVVDGEGSVRKFARVSSVALKDETGHPVMVLELSRDVTRLVRAEGRQKKLAADLERVLKEQRDFAYIVSHDLKTPLRGINSLAKWMSEDHHEFMDQQGREYLDKMLIRTRRLYNLIDGILQYINVGKTTFEPRKLESAAVVGEIIEFLSRKYTFDACIEGALPNIVYDESLLARVFQELIENAIQHMGNPEGSVVVSCTDAGDVWEFCVLDDGVGIEERHFERIFGMFQSLTPESVKESTGVGLPLVKKIVERAGGVVRVESAVGFGSAFFFTTPKRPGGEKAANHSTVLIMDDHPDVLKVAAAMLAREGCTVLTASSRHEAFQILEDHQREIHVVLFDIDGPWKNVVGMYEIIRGLRPGMKIVACTGAGLDETVEQLKKRGVDEVITKPFKIGELNSIL